MLSCLGSPSLQRDLFFLFTGQNYFCSNWSFFYVRSLRSFGCNPSLGGNNCKSMILWSSIVFSIWFCKYQFYKDICTLKTFPHFSSFCKKKLLLLFVLMSHNVLYWVLWLELETVDKMFVLQSRSKEKLRSSLKLYLLYFKVRKLLWQLSWIKMSLAILSYIRVVKTNLSAFLRSEVNFFCSHCQIWTSPS